MARTGLLDLQSDCIQEEFLYGPTQKTSFVLHEELLALRAGEYRSEPVLAGFAVYTAQQREEKKVGHTHCKCCYL